MLCRDDGVGLAAPQVGVNVRLMVYNPTGRRGDKEYILVNPSIVSTSPKSDVAEEGCLSFPRIFADVEVPPHNQRTWLRTARVHGYNKSPGDQERCKYHEVGQKNSEAYGVAGAVRCKCFSKAILQR